MKRFNFLMSFLLQLTFQLCTEDDDNFTQLNGWLFSEGYDKSGKDPVTWSNKWIFKPEKIQRTDTYPLHTYACVLETSFQKKDFEGKVEILDALSEKKKISHFTKCYYNKNYGVIIKVINEGNSVLDLPDLDILDENQRLEFYIKLGELLAELDGLGGHYDLLSLPQLILQESDVYKPIIVDYSNIHKKGTGSSTTANFPLLSIYVNSIEVCEEILQGRNGKIKPLPCDINSLFKKSLSQKSSLSVFIQELSSFFKKSDKESSQTLERTSQKSSKSNDSKESKLAKGSEPENRSSSSKHENDRNSSDKSYKRDSQGSSDRRSSSHKSKTYIERSSVDDSHRSTKDRNSQQSLTSPLSDSNMSRDSASDRRSSSFKSKDYKEDSKPRNSNTSSNKRTSLQPTITSVSERSSTPSDRSSSFKSVNYNQDSKSRNSSHSLKKRTSRQSSSMPISELGDIQTQTSNRNSSSYRSKNYSEGSNSRNSSQNSKY